MVLGAIGLILGIGWTFKTLKDIIKKKLPL